jgi:hypothetical protein
MSEMFDIRIFDHPVELEKCQIDQVLCRGQSLSDIKEQFAPKRDVIILLDGRQVSDADFKNTIVKPGCTIDIIPAIGWFWAVVTWIFTKIVVPMAIGFGISYLGGLLTNQDVKQPDENNRKDSQNFGWDPHTTFQEGLVRNRNYGRNLHTGNVLARWTDDDESGSEKLYLVLDHGDGPTGGIETDKVYLNDQPSANFDVTIQERIGTADQTVMTGFEKHKNEFRPALDITNDGGPVIFTTPDKDFDDIEFTIEFPRGLWRYTSEGGRAKNKVDLMVQIREVNGSWTTLFDNKIEGKSMSPIYKAFTVSELPTFGSLGFDEEQDPPIETFTVERGKQYELKFTKVSNDNPNRGNDVKLRSVRQVYDVAFTRPGKALVGITAVGTANLSGDLNVKVVRKDRLVRVFNGTSWSIEWTRNRAWVTLDILTQPVIAGNGDTVAFYVDKYEGIDPSKIDLAFFYDWAEWCDDQVTDGAGGTEARMTCDFLGDYETDMFSLAHEMAQIGRAYLYWFGNQLTGWHDAAVDAPFDMVTMQNMVAGSWKNSGPVHSEKAGEAQVYYRDSQEFYKRKSIICPNEDAGVYTRKIKIEGTGITSKTLAQRAGNHSMQRNKLIWNKNQFTMYKDASKYRPGYVLRIQRDEPDWGRSYRVVDLVDTYTVQLDRAVTATPGDNLYLRQYNSSSEQIETTLYEVDSVDGNQVTVTTEWIIGPVKDNIIAIGTTVLRRITKMKVRQDNYYDLEVETYDEDLFDSDDTEPYNPNPDYHWPEGGDPADRPTTWRDVMDILENTLPSAPNINVPWTSNITWSGDDVDTVSWAATDEDEPLYFRYKGVTYEITADSTAAEFIYWDPDYTDQFRTTNISSVVVANSLAGGWFICRNIDGVPYVSVPIQSLWAGIIQAGTVLASHINVTNLAAISANMGTITSGTITLSLGGNTRLRIDSNGLYISNNAGSNWTEVIKNDAGTVTMFADILKAGEIITEKIANYAVTTPVGAYTSGVINIDTSYLNVQSVAITTTGKPVHITGSLQIYGYAGPAPLCDIQITRGGTVIYEANDIHTVYPGTRSFSAAVSDSPGAGSYTYYLKAKADVDSKIRAVARSLVAEEFKK